MTAPPESSRTAPLIIGLGELLWDCFADTRRPGGAPANVAWHAAQLGARGLVVSRVGTDPLGNELLELLARRGLDVSRVQTDERHPTGTVTVETSSTGQPDYTIHDHVAWDYLEFDQELEQLIAGAAAVCFGTLAQRHETSRDTIHRCLDAIGPDGLSIYDVNLRQDWWDPDRVEDSLERCDIVKLNDEELERLAGRLDWPQDDPTVACRVIRDRYRIDIVCVTRGADGCLLVSGEDVADVPGEEIEVSDTVGAGDAFTAAMIWSQWKGWSLETTARLANRVGARVAASPGGMPSFADALPELIADLPT